jgi:hypothetical protein
VFDVRLLRRRSLTYHDNAGFELAIRHVRPDRGYVVERCLISGTEVFTPQPAATAADAAKGTLFIRENLPPPGIELITVRFSTSAAAPKSPASADALHCITEAQTQGPK